MLSASDTELNLIIVFEFLCSQTLRKRKKVGRKGSRRKGKE